MAWDWDVYFNSGNRPGPEHRERPVRLRLIPPMNWDSYFNSGSTASSASQGRRVPSRLHVVPSRRPGT
ncbi:hypothetical protein [Streptomyces roseolus]|uniref:hypothetical protein n=1 Tax=Streptomyces roseolus TaxID=67358 RepID=UPI0037BA3D72